MSYLSNSSTSLDLRCAAADAALAYAETIAHHASLELLLERLGEEGNEDLKRSVANAYEDMAYAKETLVIRATRIAKTCPL